MFLKQLLSCDRFYAIDDGAGSTNLDDKPLTKDDIYDELGKDDEDVISLDVEDKKIPIKETKAKEEGEEETEENTEEESEDDELKAIEEELEGPDDEQLEIVTPVRRREILAKYPKIFQDFPYLEKAYYREQQFTEIYPTIDDAREAATKAQNLDKFESEIMHGNTENILKAVKAENENAFHQIVDNYMVALYNTDQSAYYHIIGNLNKLTIAQMVNEGKRLGNDALISAATILQQFVFGTGEWSAPTRLAKMQNPQEQGLNNEKQQFFQQRYETARDDLQTRLENSLASTIEQNIDRAETMTSYVKKAACADAMGHLQRLVNGDKRFQVLQKKLWDAAANENFSKSSMDRIRSAFVSKAKTLLPSVLKKARSEALRGLGKREADNTEDRNDGSTRAQKDRKTTSSNRSSGRDSYADKAKKIPRGTSTLDYLNSD